MVAFHQNHDGDHHVIVQWILFTLQGHQQGTCLCSRRLVPKAPHRPSLPCEEISPENFIIFFNVVLICTTITTHDLMDKALTSLLASHSIVLWICPWMISIKQIYIEISETADGCLLRTPHIWVKLGIDPMKVFESMPKTALSFQVLPGQSTEYSPWKTYGDQSKTVSYW